MLDHRRRTWHLAAIAVLAAMLVAAPSGPAATRTFAYEGCTLADEVRSTTCRLTTGDTAEGTLDATGTKATYRVDVFEPGASVAVSLASETETLTATLLDWRGGIIGQTPAGQALPGQTATIAVPLPGVYGLRVDGDVPAVGATYKVGAAVSYPRPGSTSAVQPVWPPGLATGDGPVGTERQVIRVPRSGTPAGGVAASRILGAPPAGIFSDFTMVADVRFEKIAGPSALTVRFRYEPEAGGGTGYIVSLDPFGGTATLDAFREGQRQTIVGHVPLTVQLTPDATNRLVLTAQGPSIRVALDGQTIVEASDSRFASGLIATGAVTWSDPVAVTFDHIQVTAPMQ
jgi:hypothetical protein